MGCTLKKYMLEGFEDETVLFDGDCQEKLK